MKNRVVFYLIVSSFYLSISAMELAITSPLNDLYTPRTLNWINPTKQTSIIRNLLTLQKSNFSHSDISKRITYQLFMLHTQDEYEELAHICQSLRLGTQRFDIKDMISMPYKNRTKLISTYKRNTSIGSIINGLNLGMIPESDYNEVIEILPEDKQKELAVYIIPNSCCCNSIPKIAGAIMFLSGVAYSIYGIATSNSGVAPVSMSLMVLSPVMTIVSQHVINQARMVSSEEYNKLLP